MGNANWVLAGALTAILAAGVAIVGIALAKERGGSGQLSATVAKVTIQEAIKAATDRFPGRVVEAELEVEGGRVFYEVSIVGLNGVTRELLVDGLSGEVVESYLDREDGD